MGRCGCGACPGEGTESPAAPAESGVSSEALIPPVTPIPDVPCRVLADRDAVSVHVQPTPDAVRLSTVSLGQPPEVLEQRIGENQQGGYRVKFQAEDSEITGWVRADMVVDISNAGSFLGN
jgi:hypothetical protein